MLKCSQLCKVLKRKTPHERSSLGRVRFWRFLVGFNDPA